MSETQTLSAASSTVVEYPEWMNDPSFWEWSTELSRILADRMVGSVFGYALHHCILYSRIPLPSSLDSEDYEAFIQVLQLKVSTNEVSPYLPPAPQILLYRFFVGEIESAWRTVQRRKRTQERERLTKAEAKVAKLLATGASDDVIIRELGIAKNTAKTHRKHIADKWNKSETIEVLQFEARRRGY